MPKLLHLQVACAENRVIGREGRLPWRIPEDLQFFHDQTAGQTVVLGRVCFETWPRVLLDGLKGVEKESLRVQADGHIATTPHPYELGSALTSAHITTDFSESLIERVTPTFQRGDDLLNYLCDLHQFVYRHLGNELLWATSMPCELSSDADVPIAYYGE